MKDEWNRPAAVRWLEDHAAKTMGARRRRAHIKWVTFKRIRAAQRDEFYRITVRHDNDESADALLTVFVPGNDQ